MNEQFFYISSFSLYLSEDNFGLPSEYSVPTQCVIFGLIKNPNDGSQTVAIEHFKWSPEDHGWRQSYDFVKTMRDLYQTHASIGANNSFVPRVMMTLDEARSFWKTLVSFGWRKSKYTQ